MKILLASVAVMSLVLVPASPFAGEAAKNAASKSAAIEPLKVGQIAPEFRIKDRTGKEINLAELSAKGPVLVRLTCGCLGCDKELPYFQALHEAYKAQGLVSLAVFKEADDKVEAYVKEKKLNMLYAVDSHGASWDVWHTKTMPSNFLIEKGGRIAAMSIGCDPTGLTAERLSEKAAGLTGSKTVNVKSRVDVNTAALSTPKQ
ncbi:MAG: redoxin domain-containing protein [Pedosphaera sp.]|nr:redoxin domain-containing protein [Pedosphaera sp.]